MELKTHIYTVSMETFDGVQRRLDILESIGPKMKENMEKTSLPVPWPLRGQKCQLRIVQRKEDGRKYEVSLG
jgi:hypothetical protein